MILNAATNANLPVQSGWCLMETAQAFAWVGTTLLSDSTLVSTATGGVWQGFAAQGSSNPYVIFTQQSGTDVLTMNAVRLYHDILMLIKAVGPASAYASLVVIANEIDSLFKRTGPTTLSQGGVLACFREQSICYEELINGQQWSHLGGLYRIKLQGA